MTWNYRIVKHDTGKTAYFAVHEVFYDDKGKVTNWTADPIDIVGDNKSEVVKTLKQMTSDITTPVLKESELLKSSKK